MSDLIVLFNHVLNDQQRREAFEKLHVKDIVEPPPQISDFWRGVPPDGDIPSVLLKDVVMWLDSVSQAGDYCLVQGEYGATFFVVDHCFESGLLPIYATTERKMTEREAEGRAVVERHFCHVQFRRYRRSQ